MNLWHPASRKQTVFEPRLEQYWAAWIWSQNRQIYLRFHSQTHDAANGFSLFVPIYTIRGVIEVVKKTLGTYGLDRKLDRNVNGFFFYSIVSKLVTVLLWISNITNFRHLYIIET